MTWYRHKPQGIIGMKKQHFATKQVESNVESLIEQCIDIMLHEMKRIGDGWQNIHLLIPNTWKSIREWSNEECQISHICMLFMLINNYVNMRWCIKLNATNFIIICVWL